MSNTRAPKTAIRIGKLLAKDIGKHWQLIGTTYDADAYYEARRDSDEAAALAKYLIMHLDNRHHAVVLASAAGVPGYINFR